jgi:hypothetical protein
MQFSVLGNFTTLFEDEVVRPKLGNLYVLCCHHPVRYSRLKQSRRAFVHAFGPDFQRYIRYIHQFHKGDPDRWGHVASDPQRILEE